MKSTGLLFAVIAAMTVIGCGGNSEIGDSGSGGTAGEGGGSPSKPCQDDPTGWRCGLGKVCDANQHCVDGCFINGRLYAIGDKNPANPCDVCAAKLEPGWASVDLGSTCGIGKVCDLGNGCVDGCYIEGAFYALGEKNPSNACKICTLANNADWTVASGGSACGIGMVCDDHGQCAAGCTVGEDLFRVGDENPANDCEVCGPTNPTGWTPKAQGATCLRDGGSVCNAVGQCVHPQRLACGQRHTCAITANGQVKCWGSNSYGQLGIPESGGTLTPKAVPGLSEVVAISAGRVHTCALTSSGAVKCWGSNASGSIGDGTFDERSAPTDVVGLSKDVVAVSAGGGLSVDDVEGHTCVLLSGGAVKCWGRNDRGQLGAYHWTNRNEPGDVWGLSQGVYAVSAGAVHTCALVDDGLTKCWGGNEYGELGDGLNKDSNVPVNVQGLASSPAMLATGQNQTCVLESMGVVKCWGRGDYGQLGTDSTTNQSTPLTVVGLRQDTVAIFGGFHVNCATTYVGALWCWGRNNYGQVGDGWIDDVLRPKELVGVPPGIVAVSGGPFHTCALEPPNYVWCWGFNGDGQLGDGTVDNRMNATMVVGF